MKAGKEHRVPLSERALAILSALPREDDNPYVFVGARQGAPFTNMAMLELLRGMRPGVVPHGFRSTFRDWTAAAPTIRATLSSLHSPTLSRIRLRQPTTAPPCSRSDGTDGCVGSLLRLAARGRRRHGDVAARTQEQGVMTRRFVYRPRTPEQWSGAIAPHTRCAEALRRPVSARRHPLCDLLVRTRRWRRHRARRSVDLWPTQSFRSAAQ